MKVQPYLSFEGRADEAIAFYKKALGAEVQMVMRFKDAPPGTCGPGMPQPPADKVMHAAMSIGDTTVMMSDGQCNGKPSFTGISLSLDAKDDAHAAKLFNGLVADGGTTCVPLNKTFFASSFGIATDRFGVTWMIMAEKN